MKLYRNWIINEVARAGEHTNERTYVRTYSHTYVRDRPYIPSTTLLIGCKYLSGNNLPRISLICGKLFPDRFIFTLFPPFDFNCVCCSQSRSLSNWCVFYRRYFNSLTPQLATFPLGLHGWPMSKNTIKTCKW